MRRAAWFVFAAALAFAAPGSAQQGYEDDGQRRCERTDTAKDCAEKHFHQRTQLTSENGLLTQWRNGFANAKWKPGTDCQNVKTGLLEIFDMAESAVDGETARIYFGLPKDSVPTWLGSYWDHLNHGSENLIVVNDTISETGQWETFLHEGAHHYGYLHSGTFTAQDAEDCATEGEEDPNGGGGNEEDPDPEDETCTTTTEWQVRWRPCHSWSGGSLPDLTVCLEKVLVPVEVTVCD